MFLILALSIGSFVPLANFPTNYVDVVNKVPLTIIISAGLYAQKDDPLAQMKISSNCYGEMTSLILKTAKEVCGGRLLSMLEGGYNHRALADSVFEHINILLTEPE